MTKVSEAPKARLERPVHPAPKEGRRRPFIVEFYGSAVAKKWLMAVTGIMLMGFVFAHMVGNLKLYFGEKSLNHYAEWLKEIGEPIFPRTGLLWILRFVLLGAVVVHIVSAAQLTRMNRRARPDRYQAPRDYAAATFASRTMRWTGVIVALFVVYHLMDLTWGVGGAEWTSGEVYQNIINSFERWPIAIVYIVANLALGVHLYHGGWSMFQSLGWNNGKFNDWRRMFAIGFATIVVVGNVSMPLMVVTGVVN